MRPAYLAPSQHAIGNDFHAITPLLAAKTPLELSHTSLPMDANRFAKEFKGSLESNDGKTYYVFSDFAPNLKNLFLIEIIDPETNLCCGCAETLFYPSDREMHIINLNLSEIRGRGLGKALTKAFRSFLPKDIQVSFAINEIHTKGLLLFYTHKLMEKGEISDWRIHSIHRPVSKEAKYLPAQDQEKIMALFWQALETRKSPLLRIFELLRVTPKSLQTRLEANGKWTFMLLMRT